MIRPLNNNLLIKQRVVQTESGIFMPNTSNTTYEVIAIGSSVMEVKTGDKIIIDTTAIKEIKYQGKIYYLISEDKVIGIVED